MIRYVSTVSVRYGTQLLKIILSNNMTTLKHITINILAISLAIYLIGFAYCMLAIAQGADGSDMLSQHYRSVIIKIIK